MANHLFAAIDVGSFELEMGIYEMSPKNGMRQIDHLRHVIALGRETYHTGKISYRLVDEMCRVLADFSRIMKGYQVEAYRACATSAMREAVNNKIILDQIQVRTGIQVRIINNSEQRFLSYKAIAMKAAEFEKIIQKGTAIADVGFGSTQLSLFDKESLVTTQNIVPGVLKIRDILSQIQVSGNMEQSIVEEIMDHELIKFRKLYLKDRDIKNLIGIGDSIMILMRYARELAKRESPVSAAGGASSEKTEASKASGKSEAADKTANDKTDKSGKTDSAALQKSGSDHTNRITREEFNQVYEQLMGMSPSRIQEEFGINESYVGILVASAIIYMRILQMTGAEMVWTPGIRLCDGIAAEYAQENRCLKFTHSFDDDILAAARNMAKRYRCGNSHIQNVEGLAAQMFDAMKKHHGLAARDQLLLRISAVLYGCGKYISMRNFGYCSYEIIMATEIIGLSHEERETVAKVVRYYAEPFEYDKTEIHSAKLTAMLRLAVAMDASYKQKLTGCRMVVRGDELVISTSYEGDLSLENMMIQTCAPFFEEIFGITPVLKQKRRV